MALHRKHRKRLARSAGGRFKARKNPTRHRKPRRHLRRRNPSVLVANGSRRRRRRNGAHRAMVVYRARPVRHRRRRNPHRKHLSYKAHKVRRRRNGHRKFRLKLGVGMMVRLGIFGGLGVIAARIGGVLYEKYAAKYVLGTANQGGFAPDSWRVTLNEAVRLGVMGLFTWGIERGMKKAGMFRPADCQAFLIGGLAETGRQVIGLGLNKAFPANTWSKGVLDGEERPVAVVDGAGQVWILASDGEYYPREQMHGLMPAQDLSGALMRQQQLAAA